jgi:hypothetical protein
LEPGRQFVMVRPKIAHLGQCIPLNQDLIGGLQLL